MRVRMDIQVSLRGGLLIGGGSVPVALGVDRSTIHRVDGTFLIPGSAFKGKVRNGCEQVARSLEIALCISPTPDLMCPHYWLRTGEPARFCIVCEIFGSPWRPSALHFSDLLWTQPKEISRQEWSRLPKTHIRPSVALTRHRRVASSQRLFFSETVLGGTEAVFVGNISGDLPTERHLALLLLGIHSLYAVGGTKSRGLGWINNDPAARPYVLVEPTEFSLEKVVEQWL